MNNSYYRDSDFVLYKGDCNHVLAELESKVDMVFADPPYFLSNDGLTIYSGKVVSVNKGDWDKLSDQSTMEFNYAWIKNVRAKMADNATIWISGTMHNIYTIYHVLLALDFKILNTIVWEKTNPPPNFTTKFFTHSTEYIIWARKSAKVSHYYNYPLMKVLNGDKQMKDVWKLPAIARWEKEFGKHPTQKPLSVLSRTILAASKPGALILDPFSGSGTTGIAANIFNRKYIGIDINEDYLNLSIKRKEALNQLPKELFLSKIYGIGEFRHAVLPGNQ